MSAATALPLHPVRASDPPFSSSSLLQKKSPVRAKRGRGKAVTWPPEDQICQVRLFLSNDAPSTLGPAQDVLQVNHLRSPCTQSGALDVPPGFHGSLAKRSRINNVLEVSMAIGRPWLCPQKFGLDSEWLVAVGDESTEAFLQKQRELRVLEAFYPRPTCIPDSPAEPVESCKGLDDHLILTIPLVPIEDEDEGSQEPEQESKVLQGNCDSCLATSECGKRIDERKAELPTARGSLPPMPESSKSWLESSISRVDPKVAAAAAAAAACMAVQNFGVNGLVDQELLVEILRNPALLKSLTFVNQSPKDLAVPMNGNEVGAVGLPVKNQHNVNPCVGPLNKACPKVPLNAGLPSPVSVLSDWTETHPAKFFSRMPSNLSEISKFTQNFANASSAMCPSLPHKDSCSPYPPRESFVRPESAPVHRMHACSRENEMGINASHTPNASAHTTTVHLDRSCGMMPPPLSPFPTQNGVDFSASVPGRMQPGQLLKAPFPAPIVATHHQRVPVLESAPCRSSFSDARFRGIQSENSGPCSTSKVGLKTTRLCMYFNTPKGCRYGRNCAFLHQSANPDLNAVAQ